MSEKAQSTIATSLPKNISNYLFNTRSYSAGIYFIGSTKKQGKIGNHGEGELVETRELVEKCETENVEAI